MSINIWKHTWLWEVQFDTRLTGWHIDLKRNFSLDKQTCISIHKLTFLYFTLPFKLKLKNIDCK